MSFSVATAYLVSGIVILVLMLVWDANGAPTYAHIATAFSGYPIGQGIVGMWKATRAKR